VYLIILGALGLFQVIPPSWGDKILNEEIELISSGTGKTATGKVTTVKKSLYKFYDKTAKDLTEAKKNWSNSFVKGNVDEVLFIPWNQVLIAAKLVDRSLGSDTNVSVQLDSSGTAKSQKLWPAWGDLAVYRKRAGNTNMEELGVLTNVRRTITKKAVELMNPFRDSTPWNRYVRWAAGNNGSYNGALVDENNKKPRPADTSEEPDHNNPQSAGYRNYYDVLAWCFADKVHAEFNTMKLLARRFGDTTIEEIYVEYLKSWTIEQRTYTS